MLLSHAGMDVRIFERQPHLGGRTSTMIEGGYQFDLGPTFFLYPRILEEIFSAVGRDLNAEVKLLRLDPLYRIVYGSGGTMNVTPDAERMAKEISAFSAADGPNYVRFIEETRRKFARVSPVLQMPFSNWRALLSSPMLKIVPWLKPWLSVDGELKRYFQDPRVRLAFSFQSKYLGMSPFKCPSLFSILSYLEHDFGVFHPVGGCGAVSTAMAQCARDLGAQVHLDEGVQEILFEGRRAVGVRTDAGVYDADAVIVNADFARAITRLVPDRLRKRWTSARIAKKKFSCSTFMMYLGIEGTNEHLAHHTIYLPGGYTENLADIEKHHRLSDDPPIYVQNACITDPSLAPPGHSTLYVLVPVTHQHENVDWSQEKGAFRKTVLRQLGKVGITDIERRIQSERVMTPADWDVGHDIHLGATFNLAHNLGQMLHMRPRNRFEDVDGVYLTGGGTHPGSGLPVIYESARIASRLLLEDFGKPTDWLTPSNRHPVGNLRASMVGGER